MRVIALIVALIFAVVTTMPDAAAAQSSSKVAKLKNKSALLKRK
jgi:hypothetical protein